MERKQFNILLLEDDENMVHIVEHVLADDMYNIVVAKNGEEGLKKLDHFHPDIIISDIMMPLMDGYQFRDAIREREDFYLTSFVFMSSRTTTEDRVKGLNHGIDAYISKPFDLKEFRAIVDSMIQKRIQLERLVNHDALTKVYNRNKILKELEKEVARTKRYRHPLSIIMMDVDFFKNVNDTHGHPEGDSVLETIAQEIRSSLRKIDMAGRVGGEEFLIILPATNSEGAKVFAERMRERISSLEIGSKKIQVTISGGTVTAPDDGVDSKTLISKADEALYQAKRAGRDKIVAWSVDNKE